MASTKRDLIKGPLKAPPLLDPSTLSSTQVLASRSEISVRRSNQKEVPVVEFSSTAVPQPFLDPSILQHRIQAEKQWRIEQEKKAIQGEGEGSSSSRRA